MNISKPTSPSNLRRRSYKKRLECKLDNLGAFIIKEPDGLSTETGSYGKYGKRKAEKSTPLDLELKRQEREWIRAHQQRMRELRSDFRKLLIQKRKSGPILTDVRVASDMGFTKKDFCPRELIALKREQIKLMWAIKETTKIL